MSNFVRYQNGNYTVTLDLENGTKIRENDLDFFEPEFAESCDVNITYKCDGNCPFCYLGCTPSGKHGDILSHKFLDTIPPYTELAINGNDLSHPDLVEFMAKMKARNVIVNMTVNQMHFERKYDVIKEWIDEGFIHGLGVSLREPTVEFIDMIKTIPNAVIHVINGVVTMPDLDMLACNGLKILILGYKEIRRGAGYYEDNMDDVKALQKNLSMYLFPLIIRDNWFKAISFDNLAIEQLEVQKHLSKEKWNEFYMGDDGNYTFYIDMVNGTFSKNSLSEEKWPVMDDVKEMFKKVREER